MDENVRFSLMITAPDIDDEGLDDITSYLMHDLHDLGVDDVTRIDSGEPAPAGAKGDPFTLGALALIAAPAILPALIAFVQAWTLRDDDRQVTIKTPGGLEVTFSPETRLSQDELLALVEKLGSAGQSTESSLPLQQTTHHNRMKLRELLNMYFSESEIQALCFDLNIDYENLPGNRKGDKVIGLLASIERREQIPDLLKLCAARRPNAPWHEVMAA